jgi:hypothetical protein
MLAEQADLDEHVIDAARSEHALRQAPGVKAGHHALHPGNRKRAADQIGLECLDAIEIGRELGTEALQGFDLLGPVRVGVTGHNAVGTAERLDDLHVRGGERDDAGDAWPGRHAQTCHGEGALIDATSALVPQVDVSAAACGEPAANRMRQVRIGGAVRVDLL